MTKLLTMLLLTGVAAVLVPRVALPQTASPTAPDLAEAIIVVDGMMKSKSGAT